MYLYIDTSYELIIGILGLNFEVLSIDINKERRSATVIHEKIDSLLKKHGTEASNLLGVIVNNGPGSYTGVRVGEGLAKIFELDGTKVVSFLEHEAIALISQNGTWVSNAFKDEIFVYSWGRGDSPIKRLIKLESFENVTPEPIFSNDHFQTKREIISSKKILLENISRVGKHYFERNERQKPFYYRELEEEFKVGKP